MNINSRCRLCYDTLSEFQQCYLYDKNGQCTEIYEITVKYFDPPMLLVADEMDDSAEKFRGALHRSKVICCLCWGHIKEFHDFQQCVLKNQTNLTVNDIKRSLSEVKEETVIKIEVDNEEDLEHMNAIGGEIVLIMDNNFTEYYDNDDVEEDENIKYLHEKAKIKPNTDDDKHVINEDNKDEYIKKKNSKESKKVKNASVDKDSSEESLIPKKRRCRKPKKSSLKADNDDETKPGHYNSMKKTRELDNFITQVKPQLECDICKEILPNYNDLRQHFTEKHQSKCFVLCCGKKIYRRYLLVEHLRVHVNPDSFKCDICGVSSSSSRSLHAHKRFMHGNVKTIECEICHKHFKTKPILIRHMEIHNEGAKDFKCPECDRCYGSDYQLKAHINKIHLEAQICDQCGKTVHGLTALKQHIIHQHSDVNPTKFPCDQCDAKLASKKGLNAHKLSFHNDGLTAFICKLCGKITSSESALLRHKKYVHEMERKYKCQYCDKAFKKNANLKEHISIHTGQHLYTCYHCPQTFGNSANMHNHRRKAHPEEFALSKENRIVIPKVDLNCVVKEVFL